ncbi:uncharacterized protein JCM6883_001093 [Sporobolomyces salmoneus]|uniref:uncharacterized protein n=1 Tax=Sporobolomyces salmoneus TaxID=183962 RepID=UPI003177A9FB
MSETPTAGEPSNDQSETIPTLALAQPQPVEDPAPTTQAALFRSQASSTTANDSNVNSPSGETDQLASSDEDEQPLATITTTNHVAEPAQATSQGGAIAGPGPSSSAAMKRPLQDSPPPLASTSSVPAAPSTNSLAPPPAKKRRGRASIPLISNSYNPPPLPHYTIIRANGTNSKHNRHVIKFNSNVTDGTKTKWPKDNEFDPRNKEGGKTYWFEREVKDAGRHKNQLEKIGDELARLLAISKKGEFWILDAFPRDYLFTVHHTVTGSGQIRTDPYVFGSPSNAKFRSANEIIPHLFWLLTHAPDNRQRCKCQYCTKRTQTEVNKNEGLTEKRSTGTPQPSTSTSTSTKPKRSLNPAAVAEKKAKEEKKPKASTSGSAATSGKQPVRSRTFNSDSPEPSYSGAFVDKQRDSDLLGRAKFRQGEMVWAQIPQDTLVFSPSPSSTDTNANKSEEESKVCITHWPAIIRDREERTNSTLAEDYVAGSNSIPKFSNEKRWIYQVQYLGTKNEASGLEETDVKAWLDTSVPDNVWAKERLLSPETIEMIWNGNRVRKVQLEALKGLEQAVAPLAFAMQIAAHVMSSFSLIDRFIIKDGHFVTAPHEEGVSEQARLEMQRAKNNWFYQSIYFGSELVWVNDFVRVIHHRDQDLPPHHQLSEGAQDRSLFMQIHAIWKDQASGNVKLTGQIYQLKDLMQHEEGAGTGSVGVVGEAVGGLGAMSIFEKRTSPSIASTPGGGGGAVAASPVPVASTSQNGDNSTAAANDETVVDETSTPPQSSSPFHSTPLPPAPEGFEFNRVTPGESQISLSLDYLAGRYYPLPKSLNSRAKIDPILESFPFGPVFEEVEVDGEMVEKKKMDVQLSEHHRAIALAGLTPAVALYCKATRWKGDRMTALTEAETTSCTEVANWFEQALKH